MDVARRRSRTRSSARDRILLYVLGTVTVCAVSAVIGETFFPAELVGDTGENEFAGLAGLVWALGALIVCVAASIAYEVYARFVQASSPSTVGTTAGSSRAR